MAVFPYLSIERCPKQCFLLALFFDLSKILVAVTGQGADILEGSGHGPTREGIRWNSHKAPLDAGLSRSKKKPQFLEATLGACQVATFFLEIHWGFRWKSGNLFHWDPSRNLQIMRLSVGPVMLELRLY